MSYRNLIGKPLSEVIKQLENYKIIKNNFNVVGDELVTNVKEEVGNYLVLTTGEFIFNLKGN